MAQSAQELCVANWVTSDLTKIVDIGGKAIHLLEEHHLEKDFFGMGLSVYSAICSYYGVSLGWMGRFKEGTDVVEKGFRNACEINDKFEMGFTQLMHSSITYLAGYGDNTIMHAQKAIKTFEEAEISIALDVAWSALGAGYYLCGEYEKAIDAGDKGLKLAKESGLPYFVSLSYSFLAMSFRAADDLRRARECAEEALRISQECNSKGCEGMVRIVLGSMVEEMTPAIIEEAQYQIRQGISILEGLKLKLFSALGYLHLGEFFTNAGRKEEALESLKKAESLYLEIEITPQSYWLKRTQEAMAKLEQ
jgi:tetratricopeptide (TPR) repeat protein